MAGSSPAEVTAELVVNVSGLDEQEATARAAGVAVRLDEVDGPITVRHTDGRLRLEHVRSALDLVGDRSRISVRLAVPTRARIETRDAPLDISLPSGGVTLAAAARGGNLQLHGIPLTSSGDDAARHAFGPVDGGGPTITAVAIGGDLAVRR